MLAIPWGLTLAQIEEAEEASELIGNITVLTVINAILSLFLAYGLMTAVQALANWLSERVPRRFRLIIKQSIPFWKGIILLVLRDCKLVCVRGQNRI